MNNLFGFIDMMNDYEKRKVGKYENEKTGLMVSTAKVTDSDYPFETAVQHPLYNNDKIVIVENYNTKEEAEKGHQKWVTLMTSDNLPKELKDVGACFAAKMLKEFSTNSSEDEDDDLWEKERLDNYEELEEED